MRDRKGTFRRAVGLLLALRAREAQAILLQLAVSYGKEGVERDEEHAEAALVLATAGYCSRQLRRFDEADVLLRRASALLADAAGADGVRALPAAFLAGAASAACCLGDVEPWELCCIDLTRVISSPLPSAKASPGADGCWRAATATEDVPITVLLHTKTRTTLVLSPASSFRFSSGPDTPLQLCSFEASIFRTAGTNPESVQLYMGPYQRKILRAVETLTSAIERGSGKSISKTWSWDSWMTVSSTPKADSDSGAVKIVHAEWPTTCSLVLTDEGFVMYGTETALVVEHGRVRNDDNPSASLDLDEDKDARALADLTDHPELAFKIGVTIGLSLLPPAAIGGVGSGDGDGVGRDSGEVLRDMACKLKHVGAVVKDMVQSVEMLVVGGNQLHIAAATGDVKALAEGLLLVECCQSDGSVGGSRAQLPFGCNCLNCVNGRDSKGRTAIHVAAAMFSDFRHLRVLEALLEKGARVDVRSQEGLLQSPACLTHQKPPTAFERAVELLSCEAVLQESSAPTAGPQVGSIVTIISSVTGAPADRPSAALTVGMRLEIDQVMHWQNAWYATCTRWTTLWFPLSSTDWRDGGLQLGAEPLPLSPILVAIKSKAPHAILAFDRLLYVLYQRECKSESKSAALATLHAQEIGDTQGASTVLELTCERLRNASSQQHREAALRALSRMLYTSAVKPVLRNGITFASFQPPACMETVVPAGVALTAIGLAMNDGRHGVSAGVPLSGVLSGLVTVNSLLRAGWKVHRRIRDCHHGAPSTLEFDPGKGAWVLIGALDRGTPGFFVLAAAARREDVFKKTSGSTTHLANGVYWYNSSNSFGFSGHPTVRLEDGQDVCDEEGESRLSISSQYLRREPGFGRLEGPPLSRVGMSKFDVCESTFGWEVTIMYFDGTGQGGERATKREWSLGERVSLVQEASGQVFEATRLDGTPCQVPGRTIKTPTVVEKGRGNLEGKWCISAIVSDPITCWIEGAYLQPVDRFPDNICLAGCKLECLPSSAELHAIGCSSLFAVRRLSLSDNMLHTLPADFNVVMPCISELDLSKNWFASYPTVLGDCLHLKEVNLVRNSLSKTDWLWEILNKWPHFATDPPAQLEAIRLDFPCTSTDALRTLILTLSRRTIERSTSTCIDLRERGLGGVEVDELQQPLGEAFDSRQGVGKALQETLCNEQSLSRIHTHRLKSRFIEGGQFCDLCGGMDVQGFFCGHRPHATMPLPPDPETEESHKPVAEREDGFRGRGRYPSGGFGRFGGGFGAFGAPAPAPGGFDSFVGGLGAFGGPAPAPGGFGSFGGSFGASASRPPSRGAGQECRFFACTACASYIGGSGPKSCRNIEANGRRIEFVLDGHRVTLFVDSEDYGIVEAIHWDAPIRELCVQMDSLRTRSFRYELMTCSFLSALSVLVAQASEPAVLFSGHGQMVLRTQSETWTCIACDASVQQKLPQEQCWRCEQCENVSLCLDCLPDLHASTEAARQGMRSVAFLDLRGNNLEQLPAGLAEHAARCGGRVLFGDVSTPLSSAKKASVGARKDHTTRQKASTSLFVNEYLMPGKYQFTGQLKEGKEHGQGTRFYADGCIMQTIFTEGAIGAKGTLTTSSGTYEGDIAKQDKKKKTKKKTAQPPRCTAAVGDTPAADATTGSSAGESGSGEERKRVNIEEPLRSLVRTSSGDQPWCLQARRSGDLGRKTPPSTQSLIYCALIANIVGSDSTHSLANTRVQMDAVEEFWTEIFPPWRGWVREYRAAGVISRITPASVDVSERAALVPDTTSEFHDTAGYGPYFIAEAQTEILGHLPATLAEVEAYVMTFWSSMSRHADQGAQLDFHPSGHGIMRYADGSVYSGEWKDGARYGKGCFDWSTKFEKRPRYEGDWQHDKLDGEGMLMWPDGTRFVGSFKENCPSKGVVDTSSASSPSFSVRFGCVAEIECERGHVLQMQVAFPSWTCNRCNKPREGSRRLRCDRCDYDCCKKCQTRLMGDTFNMLETSELPKVASRQEIGNICADLWSAIVKGASELYGARGCDLPLQDRIRVFRLHVENSTSFPDVSLQHPSTSFDEFGNRLGSETYSETRRAACKITYRQGRNAIKQILKALSGAGVSKKLQWAIEVEIQDRPSTGAFGASSGGMFGAGGFGAGSTGAVPSFGSRAPASSAPAFGAVNPLGAGSGGFGSSGSGFGFGGGFASSSFRGASTGGFGASTGGFGASAGVSGPKDTPYDGGTFVIDAPAALDDIQKMLNDASVGLSDFQTAGIKPFCLTRAHSLQPNPLSVRKMDTMKPWFVAWGRLLGCALWTGKILAIPLARFFCKRVLEMARIERVRAYSASGPGPAYFSLVGSIIRFNRGSGGGPKDWNDCPHPYLHESGPEWRYRVTEAITKNAKIFVKCELLPADEAQLYEITGNGDNDDRFGVPAFGAFRGRGGFGRGGRGRGGGAFGRAFRAFPPSQDNVSTSEDESVDSDSDFSSSSSSQAEEQEAEERQRDGGGFGGAHGRDGRQRFIAGWMPVSVTDAQVKNNQECEAAWVSLRRQHQNLPYQGTFLAPEGYRPISGQPVRVKRLLHPPVFFSSAELEEIAKEEDAKDVNVADRIQRAQDEAFRSAKEAGMSDADAERIASDAVEETCATMRAEKRKKEETTPLTDVRMDTTVSMLLGSNPGWGSGNLLGDMRGLQGLSVLPDWAMLALGLKDGDEVEIEALPPPLNQVGRAMVSCPTERSWHCGCKHDGSARCAQGFSCRDCRAVSSPDLTGRLAHASLVSWRLSNDNLGEVEVFLRRYIGALLHKRGLLCIKVGMSMPIQWGSDVITVCAESIVDADNKAILEAALTAQTAHALLLPLQAQRPLLAETSKLEAGKGMSKWRLIALVIKTANLSGTIADDTLLVSDMMSDYLEQAARDDIDRDHIRRNEFAWLLRHKITDLDDEGTLPPRFQSLARGAMQRELSTLHSGERRAGEYFSQLALPPDSAREAITLSERGKRDLLRRWLRRKLYEEVQEQAFWVSRGLREVVSVGLLDLYSAQELQYMLGGGPAVSNADLAAWQQHTAYGNGLEEGDERVTWFWQAVAAMSPAARAGVWRYATGRNQPPPESEGGIGGMDTKFNLVALSCDQIADGALVTAQTCFHELQLPRYSSAQVTARQLARSVEEGLQVPDDLQSFEATQRRLQMKVQQEMAKAAAYGEGLALQAQMRALFPNSYMCGKCSFGPVDHVACHSLASHHGERTAGGGVVRNNCPKCGWFSSQLEGWPRWDGRVWKEEDPEKNDSKAAAGGQTAANHMPLSTHQNVAAAIHSAT